MDRIEHTRQSIASGKGARKLTREGPRTACLEIGGSTYPNGEAGYAMIPARDEYAALLSAPTDFTIEFTLEIREAPTSTGDYETVLCWGSPYTADALNLELYLTKDSGSDAAHLYIGWTDDGTYSASTNRYSKSWQRNMYINTVYHCRLVVTFNLTTTPDVFELFVDNVSAGTVDNSVTGTKRPIQANNAPIYLGGIGGYPNVSSGRDTAKVRIQDLRIYSAALDEADATVVRFTTEALIPEDSTYSANLLGYWPLDEGAGHIVHDKTHAKNHGFLGPGAIAITDKVQSADGALYLDGHTNFLQADLRYHNAYEAEWRPNSFINSGTEVRYGLSLRLAVLDLSRVGTGAVRVAELMGSDRRDRPAAALEIDTNGMPRFAWYDGGSIQYLTASTALTPGKVHLFEFFLDGANNTQEFYIDGELADSDVRAGCDADLPKFLRVGSSADYGTDNQTFWSRNNASAVGAPILVEEVRFWMAVLDADAVEARWEKVLTAEQIIEDLGVSAADVTNNSTTVTAQGTPSTDYIDSFLVTKDTVRGLNETTRKATDENKVYYIANISGSTITLVTPYRGRTITGKGVGVTRLGGYWKVPAPSAGYLTLGANDLVDFSEIDPPSDPDYEGSLVETESQVASFDFLEDQSPIGQPLRYCSIPYETQVSASCPLPKWRMGIMRKQASPGRLLVPYEQEDGTSQVILQHHSSLLHVDDRWRINDSPIDGDSAPGTLAFLGGKDHVLVPQDADLGVSTNDYSHWTFKGWIFLEGATTPMAIACLADEDDPDEINHLLYYDRGRFRFRFCTGGDGRDYYTTAKALRFGWHYIEATFVSGTYYLFVDGKLETSSFDVVGAGGTDPAEVTNDQYIGWVPECLRTAYNAFKGRMADLQLATKDGLPDGSHTTDYERPSARATAGDDDVYCYRLNDGIDAVCDNLVSGGSDATVASHPFVPVLEGLGVCPDSDSPVALTINRRLYASTGEGPPKVWDGEVARRAGIIPPVAAPYVRVGYVNKWAPDNPDYDGANQADADGNNWSLSFEGYNYVRCAYKAAAGMNLSGRQDSADDRDTGIWDMWFKPQRLDIPMVLFGKNFGKGSGNYAVVLEPNSTKTALRPKFIFWCKHSQSFKWFATNDYPINSTSNWTYLWIIVQFGEAGASRTDEIKLRVESGVTGDALTNYGNGSPNTLDDSGDLGVNDQPDDTNADIMIGWSPIVIEDQYYQGFFGKIAEFRMASDTNNDATRVTRAYTQNPTVTPDHIFQDDPTDAAYETGGAEWAGTNISEVDHSVVCLNFNDGKGETITDTGGHSVTVTLEDYHANGVEEEGTIRVRVTFYDPVSGLESNPSPIAEVAIQEVLGPDVPARAWLRINNLPIASDCEVELWRRVYRTVADGATYYLCAEVQDSRSGGVIAEVRADLLVNETALEFDHSPPPRFRVASTDQDRLYIAKVGEVGAYYSKTFFPEYMPAEQFLPLTNDKESFCRAIGQLYGYTVFFMEEAIIVGTFVSDAAGLKLAVVGTDGGALSGASLVSAARMLWRPSKNGIYAFTGSSDAYRGRPIGRPDGFWNNVDLRWGGVTGTYWRPREQAIWVLRKNGNTRPGLRIALDLSAEQTGEQASPAYVFTVSESPEISCIGAVETDLFVPRLLAADYTGAVWILDEGTHDGPRAGTRVGALTTGSTTTTLNTTASDLDVVRDGLRGMVVTVANTDGTTGSARIRSNTASAITLMEALPFTPADGATYQIGGRPRFWKTGFLSYHEAQEAVKRWEKLDLTVDAEPSPGIRITAWIDFNEDKPYDLGVHATDDGHILVPLTSLPRSRYLQLEFRGLGPFTIHDYTVSVRDGQQDTR